MFEGLECLGATRMSRGSLFCVRDDAAEPSFLSPELCDLVVLGRLGLFLLLFFRTNRFFFFLDFLKIQISFELVLNQFQF